MNRGNPRRGPPSSQTGKMVRQPRTTAPPIIDDDDYVHPEIRELAAQTKQVLQKKFQRHGTNAEQITAGIRQFGASKQSKVILQRERAAAILANRGGIYGVWRNENARHAENRDFCSRVGPNHRCFCGHILSEHRSMTGARGSLANPPCNACPCDSYRFMPNEPEEVGDHWLSRRPGFVPGAWHPKCRCGHQTIDHDPRLRGGRCKKCTNCVQFEGAFRCLVCDGRDTDHVTLFETEDERRQARRPVGQAFAPLHDMDEDIQEAVFGPPKSSTKALPDISACVDALPAEKPLRRGAPTKWMPYCESCASLFRSETAMTCQKCGAPRQPDTS